MPSNNLESTDKKRELKESKEMIQWKSHDQVVSI